MLRTILFWLHLTTGALAGVVILVMCVTGVVLTYEKQMLEWADRGSGVEPPSAAAAPQSPETLLAAVTAGVPDAAPTGITVRADRGAPATVTLEGNRTVLVDPYAAAVLGEPAPGLRRFFRTVTSWHRYLALEGTSRATGKAITGVANLGFLFIVLSGMYLWLPKILTWIQVKQVIWFRRGLTPKARDFNWHNVIGIWSAIPLAVVVAGAVPISFGWGTTLVLRLAGDPPPASPAGQNTAPQQAGNPGGPGGPRGAGRAGGAGGPGGAGGGERRGGNRERQAEALDFRGLDAAFAAGQASAGDWRTSSVRLAGPPDAPFVVTVDAGYGGQPQHRTTVTVDRTTAAVVKREVYTDLTPGRQWRTWLRFAHTGEFYGLPGQTVAGMVSAGGSVLVYTGLALALRRFLAWRRRRATATTGPRVSPARRPAPSIHVRDSASGRSSAHL